MYGTSKKSKTIFAKYTRSNVDQEIRRLARSLQIDFLKLFGYKLRKHVFII